MRDVRYVMRPRHRVDNAYTGRGTSAQFVHTRWIEA